MRDVCIAELVFLEGVFRELERRVPPPIFKSINGNLFPRYEQQSPHQAIILKFARQISGLHAIDILLQHGFLQEQAVVQRTLDEFAEDIMFLACGILENNWSELHQKFSSYFWQEEFDHPKAMKSTQKRGSIPRSKIRAYNNRAFSATDPSTADRAGESVHKVYSGYVHAAAPQIMDMWGENLRKFYLAGMGGTPRQKEHADDAINYFYRGLLSANFASKAFGNESLASATYARVVAFENAYGEHVLPHMAESKGTR